MGLFAKYDIRNTIYESRTPFIYPAEIPCSSNIIVEIGPGRGDFLFHLAQNNPDAVIYGIEIKRQRVDKLIKRIEKRGLKNIIVIQDDARHTLESFFGAHSVSAIHINFPDPWPKRKHLKNRLFSDKFIKACNTTLKSDGELIFITDHKPYADSVFKNMEKMGCMKCVDFGIMEPAVNFQTFFEEKWRKEGRTIYRQKYTKLVLRT